MRMMEGKILEVVNRMKSWIKDTSSDLPLSIIIPVFIFSFLLEMGHFFPNLTQMNVWDEASYIQFGYNLLVEGKLITLADSPLSSFFYAITLIPVINSPDFFVLSNAIARITYFKLVFVSVYLIASELKNFANPWIMLGLVLVVPVATTMYQFPSDVLFAGLAGLAFWQILAFYNRRKEKHIWWASFFLGFATLARVEGLILFIGMVIFLIIIIKPFIRWYRIIKAVLIPFLILVGGYIILYGLITGSVELGLAGRTFYNFESGHEVIYSNTGIFNPTVSSRLESREAFGTPEENNNSVFRAISRNPSVYSQRLRRFVPSFINYAIKAYGNKFVLLFIWLSIRGVVYLLQNKHLPLALLGILWFAPLAVAFRNTFIREGYFMMPFFIVFVFTSIGLTAIINNFNNNKERIGLVVAGTIIIFIGLITNNSSMLYRSTLFLIGFGIIFTLYIRSNDISQWQQKAYWILLVVVLIMRGSYTSPKLPEYGNTDTEKAVYFLQENFPIGSGILSGAPANVWAARMKNYGINSTVIPDFEDENEFLVWLQVQKIKAIFVDQHFPNHHRKLVESLLGNGLYEKFSSTSGIVSIVSVLENE